MQDRDIAGDTVGEPQKTKLVTKIIAFIACIALGVVFAQYYGKFYGFIIGVAFWWWIYSVALKYRPKTRGDIVHEKEMKAENTLFRPYLRRFTWVFGVVVVCNVILFFAVKDWAPALLTFDMVAAFVFFMVLVIMKRRSNMLGRADLASELGFVFSQNGDIVSAHEKLRLFGVNARISNIFSGTIDGFPVRIFDFFYEWAKKAAYSATILEVTNSKRCPNMLIISKSDAFGETFNPAGIFPGIPVHLEGNFSDHFSLFVENGGEDEVRQFLTPDLMADLIDTMPELSFLFFDTQVYVVLSNNSEAGFSPDGLREQLEKARFVIGKWALTLSKMDF